MACVGGQRWVTGATARDETTDYGTTHLTESRRYGKGLAGARPSMRTPLRETYSRRFEFIRGSCHPRVGARMRPGLLGERTRPCLSRSTEQLPERALRLCCTNPESAEPFLILKH